MNLRVAIAAAWRGNCPAQTRSPLATHDALFASFIPIREVAAKPELVGAFTQAREGSWMDGGQARRRALVGRSPICELSRRRASWLRSFKARLMRAFRAGAAGGGRWYLLQSCGLNDARRLALGAPISTWCKRMVRWQEC